MGRPFRAGLLPQVCASLLSFTWHVAPASMYGGFPNSSVLHIHNREFSIPIEILLATASEEASTWETAFQEGSGLPLWAPHVLRVPSPGPHSLLCRSLCPFCCFLRFIFPIRAAWRNQNQSTEQADGHWSSQGPSGTDILTSSHPLALWLTPNRALVMQHLQLLWGLGPATSAWGGDWC